MRLAKRLSSNVVECIVLQTRLHRQGGRAGNAGGGMDCFPRAQKIDSYRRSPLTSLRGPRCRPGTANQQLMRYWYLEAKSHGDEKMKVKVRKKRGEEKSEVLDKTLVDPRVTIGPRILDFRGDSCVPVVDTRGTPDRAILVILI